MEQYLHHSKQQWQEQWSNGRGPYYAPNYPENYMPDTAYWQRQIRIEDAIRVARQQVPGEVVKAELERRGSRLIYEVDVITSQGVKYEVKVDANTGRVLEVELD